MAKIRGVIRDQKTGQPIDDIYIFACEPGKPDSELDHCVTQANGVYEIGISNVENYDLDIADNQVATKWENIVVPGNPGYMSARNFDRVLRRCNDEGEVEVVEPAKLVELMDWFVHPESGMMAVVGPPRSGKSSLVKTFLRTLENFERDNGHELTRVFYFSCENSPDLTSLFCHMYNWIRRQNADVDQNWSPSETFQNTLSLSCLLYTSPSPRDLSTSRMPSSA